MTADPAVDAGRQARDVTRWRLDVLGYRTLVRCRDRELTAAIDDLLGHLSWDGAGAFHTDDESIDVTREGPGYVIRSSGGRTALPNAAAAVDHLQWLLNQRVIDVVHRRATGLHAAAASRDGVTVVLPAVSEAGKSTLVTGMVRAGWRYLTDEAVELGPGRDVRGYRKSITLDPGAQLLFEGLRPRGGLTRSWYVPPKRVGPVGVDGWSTATHLVLPRWSPSAGSRAVRLPAGAALMELARCTFYFNSDGPRHLARLAALVRSLPAWQVRFPTLESGVALVDDVCGRQAADQREAGPTWTPEAVPVAAPVELFADGAVVFAVTTGSLHLLDPAAYQLWCKLCVADADHVAGQASARLPADRAARARAEIRALEQQLRALDLIPPPA